MWSYDSCAYMSCKGMLPLERLDLSINLTNHVIPKGNLSMEDSWCHTNCCVGHFRCENINSMITREQTLLVQCLLSNTHIYVVFYDLNSTEPKRCMLYFCDKPGWICKILQYVILDLYDFFVLLNWFPKNIHVFVARTIILFHICMTPQGGHGICWLPIPCL